MKAPVERCLYCDGTGSEEHTAGPCQTCEGKGHTLCSADCPDCACPLVCAPGHAEPWCYSCGYGVPASCPDCAGAELCALHAGDLHTERYDSEAEVWAKMPERD